MIKFEIKPKTSKKLLLFERRFDSNMKAFLNKLSTEWKIQTQRNLSGRGTGRFPAYRTGNLFRSVLQRGPQVFQTGGKVFTAHLGVFADYAGFLEHGTPKMRARPYAMPAFIKVWKRMKHLLLKYVMRPLR